jgi:hypothetical protein
MTGTVDNPEHRPTDGYAVVRLILPLNQCIGDDGTCWRCFFSEVQLPRLAYIAGRGREHEVDGGPLFPAEWKDGEFLIRLHDGSSRPSLHNDMPRQVELASRLWAEPASSPFPDFLESIREESVTWAEVVGVRHVTVDCDECANQAVNVVTRGALTALEAIQNAHSYSRSQAFSMVTAETIQPVVPIQVSRFKNNGDLAEKSEIYPVMPYLMVPRKHLTLHDERGEPSDASREGDASVASDLAFAAALQAISRTRLFSRHIELVAESAEAIYTRGRPSQGLMSAAQACEYLLDNLLFFLMWWEGLTPKAGADEFESTNNLIAARVRESYAPRLGSRWDADAELLVRWKDSVARPRNRVIHGGSLVSLGEAEDAFEIAKDLRSFFIEIASEPANASKYPPLRALLQGDGLLPREWTGMKEQEFYDHPDHPEERFQAWIGVLQGELALSSKASVDRAEVLVSPVKSGGYEWLLFDPDVHKVIAVDVKSMPRKDRRELEGRMSELLRSGTRRQYARFGLSPLPTPAPGATWRSAVAFGPGLPWDCPWLQSRA